MYIAAKSGLLTCKIKIKAQRNERLTAVHSAELYRII